MATAPVAPEIIFKQVQAELLARFEALLDNPDGYERRIRQECAFLPESDLLPHVFLAYAYTNVALAEPDKRDIAVRRLSQLIDLVIPVVVHHVNPPAGKLENLDRFNGHGVYLGHLNLALGCYRLIGGDNRYDNTNRHLSRLLLTALSEAHGAPLESYPNRSWPFDTLPCLVSLHLWDLSTSRQTARDAIAQHLAWIQQHGTDPVTQLPRSDLESSRPQRLESPRGGDLALRIALISHLNHPYAQRLYEQFTRHFWKDAHLVAGFREWPDGADGFVDADSGPIIFGLGSAATGLGLGTVIAMEDRPRMERYASMLSAREAVVRLLTAEGEASTRPHGGGRRLGWIEINSKEMTGFLFGDICLFYVIGWQPWTQS